MTGDPGEGGIMEHRGRFRGVECQVAAALLTVWVSHKHLQNEGGETDPLQIISTPALNALLLPTLYSQMFAT